MNHVKVIFCTDGIFPQAVGGMQRHSRLLIEELACSGQVELVVLHPHKERLFQHLPGIKEITIEGIDISRNYLLECYKYSERVYAVLKDFPQHVIYSQGLSVWYKASHVRHRLVINPHGLEPFQAVSMKDKLIGVPFRYIFTKLFNTAARVVSLGGELTNILIKVIRNGKDRIVVLPNAVNIPPGSDPACRPVNDPLQFLFVARFASNKGIHILLAAIKELNEEGFGEKISYNLGGKGPLYEHYSTNYNFSNVNYLGFVTDEQLNELYRTNDLFIFPTLFEGMPTVVLEAMSYGMPVIVSDTGATAELVDDTNGYLVIKNSVEALKKAVKDFYKLDPARKQAMSKTSFKKVNDHFTWKKVAADHIELFRSLAAGVLK